MEIFKGGVMVDINDTLSHSPNKSQVKRGAKRASYRKKKVFHLIDDLKMGHVGFAVNGQVFVIPLTVWRVEEHLYIHVMNKSRLQRLLESGEEVCISFAECNEWVMSKSAYHHSANYRSAVVYCVGERVAEPKQFDAAFKAVIEQLEEGRWQHIRPPNTNERKATALLKLSIIEGSFKSREGGPNEEAEDMALPVWHGTQPVCPFHKST
ncbi:MAG: nitroimidazol reductase NimA-like FMN-containing flavoprotein [Oleiphilaceae bacterium]|jgi:nitroimidazol reductase NimA-like FMN-containing flavoprotein (pyridoxamine 5'-phosphate oxidase superfamily)